MKPLEPAVTRKAAFFTEAYEHTVCRDCAGAETSNFKLKLQTPNLMGASRFKVQGSETASFHSIGLIGETNPETNPLHELLLRTETKWKLEFEASLKFDV